MTLKAYKCSCLDDDHGQVVVFAESAKAAKSLHPLDNCDCEWIERRVNRAPKFDDLAPGPISVSQYLERGFWWSCGGCDGQIWESEMPVIEINGYAYCCLGCLKRDRARWPTNDGQQWHESVLAHVAAIDSYLAGLSLQTTN